MDAEKELVATYDYRDEGGQILYQVVRYRYTASGEKTFRIRRPDGRGGWHWNRGGVERVFYRLTDLLATDPEAHVYITEGESDADRLAALGLVATTNDGGAGKFNEAHAEALRGRKCVVLQDNDEPGRRHAEQVAALLQPVAESVKIVTFPELKEHGDVSDWLDAGHTPEDLEALVDETPNLARLALDTAQDGQLPVEPASPPQIRWVDGPRTKMTQLLHWQKGRAYAATWIHTETTTSTDGGAQREVRRELAVVSDDGRVYGPTGSTPIEALAFKTDLHSNELPPDTAIWSRRGVEGYLEGDRVVPAKLFTQVARAFDHYLDFGRSVADQSAMCELSACLALMTWFQPVFYVLPYPWPNGGYGSGKTKWGTCWAGMSHLGHVVLSSTTFAVMRDLAGLGASLMFDDAESFADAKQSDGDKRALFLGGNKRGATVGLKEPKPGAKNGYQTVHVNTFCPRSFTAISLPDPVLGSRTIIIPLVRTADSTKSNQDPARERSWPTSRAALIDDLWSASLMLMSQAEAIWAELDDEDQIVGRAFDTWRAVLAVARLFERQGVDGLEERMRDVMRSMQREQVESPHADKAVLVVRALVEMASSLVSDGSDESDTADRTLGPLKFTAQDVSDVISGWESRDGQTPSISPGSVGKVFNQLRIKEERDSGKKRTRWRVLPIEELVALGRSYAVDIPEHLLACVRESTVRTVRSVRSVRSGISEQDDHLGEDEVEI